MNDTDFAYLRTVLRETAGVCLEPSQQPLLEARLRDLARDEGQGSIEGLVNRLRSSVRNGLHGRMVEALLNHETLFFRDPGLFDALRNSVIPELIARNAPERRLVIWSGACSTGQEPYSLAMVLAEHAALLQDWTLRVLASDLSPAAIERARAGVYSLFEVNRGLPVSALIRWFEQQGLEWRVREELRRRIEFRVLNLMDRWEALPPADLVLLRNVLIYFDNDAKRRILLRARSLLRPGGYLVLGAAESAVPLDEEYERVHVDRVVLFRPRPVKGDAR